MTTYSFAYYLNNYFNQYLRIERNVSDKTIISYSYTYVFAYAYAS